MSRFAQFFDGVVDFSVRYFGGPLPVLTPASSVDDSVERASVDRSNPAIYGHRKTGHFRRPETGVEFYFTASSERKAVWTLVRQLRGPHLSTWA